MRSGIWRSVMKEGEEMKRKVKEVIKNNMYSLHFDGKRINQAEYQVVCLQSSDHEIKLGALKCENGSANSILLQSKIFYMNLMLFLTSK